MKVGKLPLFRGHWGKRPDIVRLPANPDNQSPGLKTEPVPLPGTGSVFHLVYIPVM